MLTIASCLSKDHDVSLFWDNKDDLSLVSNRFGIDLSRVSLTKNIFSPSVSLPARILKSKKYDAIIVLSDGSIPFVFSKLFLHFQQPIPHVSPNFKTKRKLSRVKKIFCNSYFTKSYIDKELGVDSVVLYPPVNLHPKKVKKENIILHVGKFRTRGLGDDFKKQGFMIETFKKMAENVSGWRFVLAVSIHERDKEAFEKLQESAEGFPIEFLLNKSNKELWNIYSKAKIYWHASGFGENLEEHPELAEHFGISTVEAMGAGAVPVVISAGGQKEIVEEEKNGFLWNTQEEFIEKTKKLIADEKLWSKLSKAAKEKAEAFSGDRFCEEIQKLISNF